MTLAYCFVSSLSALPFALSFRFVAVFTIQHLTLLLWTMTALYTCVFYPGKCHEIEMPRSWNDIADSFVAQKEEGNESPERLWRRFWVRPIFLKGIFFQEMRLCDSNSHFTYLWMSKERFGSLLALPHMPNSVKGVPIAKCWVHKVTCWNGLHWLVRLDLE